MNIDEEKTVLDAQTSQTVDDLKSALTHHRKGAALTKVETQRELRWLLSRSEFPPVRAALQAGVIPLLMECCLALGSPDEQLLEAAWCHTNIAAGEPEATKSLMPALPLLVAHIIENRSVLITEQCAWALGKVAGEGEELRNILLAQDALFPLARLMLSNKGSAARTAAWALSNLIKGPNPNAATELIEIEGVLDAIVRHLRKPDELATEVAWVVVYLSALSKTAIYLMWKSDVVQLLVVKLATSETLQLLIPVLRSVGNLVAGDGYMMTGKVLIAGHSITDIQSARLGLQFLELVMRGMPNGEGPKLVEEEDGIDAMERFRFHENDGIRIMANCLVYKYFGEDYGLQE